MISFAITLWFAVFPAIECFITQKKFLSNHLSKHSLHLHKISLDGLSLQNDEKWDIYLLEEKDLDDASTLALECFYKPRLVVNFEGMNGWQKSLAECILKIANDWDRDDTLRTNRLGFQSRSFMRLQKPNFDLSDDSFILAATPREWKASGKTPKLAGIVEICLEVPNGKLTPGVKMLWDRLMKPTAEPYLCNLCIADRYRRMGLGTHLCRICEEIVATKWGKDNMYLHVENSNPAAIKLYSAMGYKVARGLSPFELKMQGMENILYFSKVLRPQDGEIPDAHIEDCDHLSALGMSVDDLAASSELMG